MNLLSRLRSEGVLLLHHDYRNGSFQDLSGNGKHGTPTVCELRKGDLRFSSATGAEVDAGADTIGTGAGSVVVFCLSRGGGESGGGRLFDNGAFALYTSATGQISYGFGTIRPGSAGGLSVGTDHVVVASWDAAGIANLYIDGSLDDGPGTIGAPSGGTDITIGNRPALDRQFYGDIYMAAAVDRELTTAEVTELTAELRAGKPDTRRIITTVDSGKDFLACSLSRYADIPNGTYTAAEVITGTGFTVGSGEFVVETATINGKTSKSIRCSSGGVAYIDLNSCVTNYRESGYGTWTTWLYKDGASEPKVVFMGDSAAAYNDVSQNGYVHIYQFQERNQLRSVTAGVATTVYASATGYVPVATWSKSVITRSSGGLFTGYQDDVLVSTVGGAGQNPRTDTTYIDGKRYFVIDFVAGDRIGLISEDNEPLLSHEPVNKRVSACLGNGARVTTSNISAGQQVPGTPFCVSSGTWSVDVETVNGKPSKVLTCVSAGIVYAKWSELRNNPGEAAYGTWDFDIWKADASVMSMAFVAAASGALTAGDYLFEFDASENLAIVEQGTGDIISGGTATADDWHTVNVTRSPAGAFELFVDGSSEGTGSDDTTTVARYITMDLDAGDKLALATLSGDPLLKKYYGVV